MIPFTRRVPFCVGHRGMESGVPGWICTSSFRVDGFATLRAAPSSQSVSLTLGSQSGVHELLHFRNIKMVRYTGAAPALSGWKPDVLAVTPTPRMKVAAGAGKVPAQKCEEPRAPA